jgi:RNA polymerase sigma-70 factor (TIGR02957 family)
MASATGPLTRSLSSRSQNIEARVETSPDDARLSAFMNVRPRLFGIAYRMLGSAADAEDIVQDVWLRWQSIDRSVIVNPAGYLATATTRLCINAATSARARHETYVGPWLPEPIDTSADGQLGPERDQSLNLAILVLLEKLTPTERAAYVLREAFDYPYSQIAEILRVEEANARQLVTRARKHVSEGRRASVDSDEQRRLLAAFVDAARKGDMAALVGLFAEDVTSVADGGGLVRAARVPVSGRERVAKFIAAVSHFWQGVTVEWIEANGQAAVLILRDGSVVALATVDVSEKGIDQILWIMRPSKLNAVLRAARRESNATSSEPPVS